MDIETNSRHYAIYGGSFDPIHKGHIALADHAVRECGIDRLIFMPAYVSPFKQNRKTAPGKDRAAMISFTSVKKNSAICCCRPDSRACFTAGVQSCRCLRFG